MNNTTQIASYYQQIEALTPTESISQSQPTNLSLPVSADLLWLAVGVVAVTAALLCVWLVLKKLISPTRAIALAAILLFMVSTPVGLLLVKSPTSLQTRAAPGEVPQNIEIKQVDNALFISWQTEKPVSGGVLISEGEFSAETAIFYIAADGKLVSQKTVIVPILSQKIYTVEILSASKWYNNGGVPIVIQIP